MAHDPDKASKLKEEGNHQFHVGNFIAAEGLYSKAIISDSSNQALYTNRAMARLKLGMHGPAIADCEAAIELVGPHMKAYFIRAQCLIFLSDLEGALHNARKALELGAETNDKSLAMLTKLVRECRKMRWEVAEKKRRREAQALERQLRELMEREQHENEALCTDEADKAAVAEEWQEKAKLLEGIFEKARAASETKREVPDWLLDDITFDVLIDPVMTKTGQSYERASIMEALRRQPLDPLTREPLHPDDLRPNIALRKACEQFLDENGWVIDW
ncbi:U-box domain-containing protein [Xylaria sp. CBS 124048]|nr:U-box domain-containing protein [Xylaria sp. CBS 124048]